MIQHRTKMEYFFTCQTCGCHSQAKPTEDAARREAWGAGILQQDSWVCDSCLRPVKPEDNQAQASDTDWQELINQLIEGWKKP